MKTQQICDLIQHDLNMIYTSRLISVQTNNYQVNMTNMYRSRLLIESNLKYACHVFKDSTSNQDFIHSKTSASVPLTMLQGFMGLPIFISF